MINAQLRGKTLIHQQKHNAACPVHRSAPETERIGRGKRMARARERERVRERERERERERGREGERQTDRQRDRERDRAERQTGLRNQNQRL